MNIPHWVKPGIFGAVIGAALVGIAGFSVDPTSGTLSAAGHAATQAVPRAFNLDPQGKFVYAAGLETGNLTSYLIDQATGELTPSEIYPVGNRPMWVLTTELGG